MKLIIDAGSTKTDWALADGNGVRERFTTEGFNPNYSKPQRLDLMLEHQLPVAVPTDLKAVYYYGTGCGASANQALVGQALQRRFAKADIHVTHDMMAAARAVLGKEKGIACILGTGANSCVYDGKEIVQKAVSLGFLLGDEGSGGHIGRQIVKSYFYGLMPDDLSASFLQKYQIGIDDFVAQLYHHSQPASYLASFANFACDHQDHPFVTELCCRCFNEFIKAYVCRYDACETMEIGFVGSVAFHFSDLLKASLERHGLTMGTVLKNPMEGLLKYHFG